VAYIPGTVFLVVWTKGQALGYLVRSTIPAPCENVAVQVLGNLLCSANQGCRLSVLSFLPHHHYIGTGHTYLIPLNTINMTPPKPPVQNPVDIPFENGIILIVVAQAPVPDSKQNTITVTVNNQDQISGK
jgi:hypothetical protein